MIIRSRIVLTMDGPPIENGAAAILGDRIVDVGTFDGVKARNSGEVVDLGEQALLPGFINAHYDELVPQPTRSRVPPPAWSVPRPGEPREAGTT